MEYFPQFDSDSVSFQRQATTRNRGRSVRFHGLPFDGLMQSRPFVGVGEAGLIEGYEELSQPLQILSE